MINIITPEYEAKYDIVLDYGSLEHIFNVQASLTCAKMCKAKVVHQTQCDVKPWFYFPCFYDFYYENGFDRNGIQTENNIPHRLESTTRILCR